MGKRKITFELQIQWDIQNKIMGSPATQKAEKQSKIENDCLLNLFAILLSRGKNRMPLEENIND